MSGRQQHARIPAPDIQRADAFRAVDLVRRDRGQIDLELVHVERHLPDHLHGVGVEQHALLFRDRANRRERLDDADLVVGGHDRDEDGLGGDGVSQLVEVDEAVLLHRQIGDPVAVLLEPLARVDHRLVLGDRGDDVIALLPVHLGDALDREVVGLGRAAREHDLLGVGADEIRDLLARLVDGLLGRPSERMVPAGGVAEMLGEVGQHRVHDTRIHGRRRVIVEINRKFDGHDCFSPIGHAWRPPMGSTRTHVGRPLGPASSQVRMQHGRPRRCRPRGVRRQLGDRALAKRRQNPLANPPERIAHVALRKLLALTVVGRRTGGHRHRAVDRLNHVGDRNLPAATATADSRRACPGATPAARAAPAAAALSPSARSGCRTARRFRERSTIRDRRAGPDASWPSARNQPFSRASAYGNGRNTTA